MTMSFDAETIAENVARVRGRIARAASQAGRSADEITLVAVTKYVGTEEIRALVAAGCAEERLPCRLRRLGVPGHGASGAPEDLYRLAGLSIDHCVNAVARDLGRREGP